MVSGEILEKNEEIIYPKLFYFPTIILSVYFPKRFPSTS
jgi:hypothetical protein